MLMESDQFPDVIPREDRVDLLKNGYTGKQIEQMAVMLAGYQVVI